jgi:hypothetical protein
MNAIETDVCAEAAPQMLAALKRVKQRLDELGDWPDSETEEMVNEAIYKACPWD